MIGMSFATGGVAWGGGVPGNPAVASSGNSMLSWTDSWWRFLNLDLTKPPLNIRASGLSPLRQEVRSREPGAAREWLRFSLGTPAVGSCCRLSMRALRESVVLGTRPLKGASCMPMSCRQLSGHVQASRDTLWRKRGQWRVSVGLGWVTLASHGSV